MNNIKTGLQKVHGLVNTKDLSAWENQFIKSIWYQTNEGKLTASLTSKQIEILERIFDKHFSD